MGTLTAFMPLRNLLNLMLLCALASAAWAADSLPGVRRLDDPPGLHNLFALGTNLYSGSTPEAEAGFASLARLGVKTIISVDGARPDVDLARKYGMRYVHLPHGYDGISAKVQLQLVQAGQTLAGPAYVHCHHGQHRGPAAAAIICMARDGWTAAQGARWLHAAGTSTNYAGLYETIHDFAPPAPDQLKPTLELPEITEVSGLVEAMVAIDETWEHLKSIRAAGYRPPQNHPDLVPANEALMLWENYRELQRLPDIASRGTNFLDHLRMAEADVKQFERLLRAFATEEKPELRTGLDRSFEALGKACTSCHKTHRDTAR
jgi:hypothetical protein